MESNGFMSVIPFQHRQEGFLGYHDPAYHFHSLLAGFLLFQEFSLSGNIASIALGRYILTQALMVVLAITVPPMAPCMGILNCCLGISSFRFSHALLAQFRALSR